MIKILRLRTQWLWILGVFMFTLWGAMEAKAWEPTTGLVFPPTDDEKGLAQSLRKNP